VQVYGDAQTVGPVQPIPPHWPYSVCVAPEAVVVLVTFVVLVEEDDLVVAVTDVVLEEDDLVVVEVVELELELELTPGAEPVDPMSPHLMFDQVTDVPGSSAKMVDGSPAVLLHGPALPLSSQFMYALSSCQILKIRTMPRLRASPVVGRPPTVDV
jgi:hypothetical protein